MANFFDRFRTRKEALPQSNPWSVAEKKQKPSFFKGRLFFGFLFMIIVAIFVSRSISFFRPDAPNGVPAEKLTDINPENEAAEKNETLPVLEEEAGLAEKYQSENFQISHISFGGDAALAVGDSEGLPIEIFGVKTESFLNEKDNESKIAVSWRSNKLTISEVSFSLADGGGTETVAEDDFGFSHSVTLPALEQGAAYVFSIKSLDRWGNARSFGYYGAYSSAKADSIFELIGKTFGETFGWAMNR